MHMAAWQPCTSSPGSHWSFSTGSTQSAAPKCQHSSRGHRRWAQSLGQRVPMPGSFRSSWTRVSKMYDTTSPSKQWVEKILKWHRWPQWPQLQLGHLLFVLIEKVYFQSPSSSNVFLQRGGRLNKCENAWTITGLQSFPSCYFFFPWEFFMQP